MAALPPPKAPSSVVKFSRWTLLGLGYLYGSTRQGILKKREDARRAKEEAERPAREAALKAENDRRNQEELAYLAKEIGVDFGGGGGGGGSSGDGGGCGCMY